MNWLKGLFGGGSKSADNSKSVRFDGLVLVPSSETDTRAEAALPGTKDLPILLELTPPPVTRSRSYGNDEATDRDYGPTKQIEVTAHFEEKAPFVCETMEKVLYGDLHKELLSPTYYVKTPEGRTTYLSSSDAPPIGKELIASWVADPERSGATPKKLTLAIQKLTAHLADSGFDFTHKQPDTDPAEIFERVERIKALRPEIVLIVASLADGQKFDGRMVWDLLHSMGFRWGDMDCFQWADPTEQTDYLIWVEADDGVLGYVLPEQVALGEQHFHEVRFSFTPPRSPSPQHVLEQMIRAAAAFQEQTSCNLIAIVDDEVVEGAGGMMAAIAMLVEELASANLDAGCEEICVVR